MNADRPRMKAAIYRRYGPPNVVQIADVPRPDIKLKELLVKVRATTITAGDSRLRSARVPRGFAVLMRLGFGILGPRKPILGWELAGEVVAVGQSVSRFAPMPRNLSLEEAAALTFGGLTSLFYLRDKARIQPGERVLINGASGAVGSAAVQLAKHFGATVTGVCSAANAQLVRSLGAEHVIDYTRQDFAQTRETYDIIFDAVGNCSFARCKAVLAPGGRLLLVVASLGQLVGALLRSSRAGRQVLSGVNPVRPADLLFLRALAESGAFKPVIDRTYAFACIVDAYSYVDTGHKKGNVVVTLD